MRTTSRFISLSVSALVLAGLAACAAPMNTPMSSPVSTYPAPAYPASTYPSYPAQNQQGSYVEFGRVSKVEVLQTQEQGKGSGLGAVLGGVAGGVVGHQIGGGTGRDVATVAGVVGGAIAGNAIEKNRNTSVRETYRVSVQLDNGASRAYDVPSYGELRVGDRVRIQNGQIYRM